MINTKHQSTADAVVWKEDLENRKSLKATSLIYNLVAWWLLQVPSRGYSIMFRRIF